MTSKYCRDNYSSAGSHQSPSVPSPVDSQIELEPCTLARSMAASKTGASVVTHRGTGIDSRATT